MVIGGADGCRTGWVVCRRDANGTLDVRVVKTLAEACEGLSILAVDMPIGFVDVPRPARQCEVEARKLMPGKASSVFPTPCRAVLACTTHADANATSRRLGIGINQQTFHLFPKMREVDELLRTRPRLKGIVHEAHPELAFARLNGGKPLDSKHTKSGLARRKEILEAQGFTNLDNWLRDLRGKGAKADDLFDACALIFTARNILQGRARHVPEIAECDSRGLRMSISF